MAAILGWDFRHTSSSMRASLFQQGGVGSIKRTEVTSVSPGQNWSQVRLVGSAKSTAAAVQYIQDVTTLLLSQVLLAPSTSDWLIELMSTVATSNCSSSLAIRSLAYNARQLLVAFCSLSGEVLPRRPKSIPTNLGADALAAATEAQGMEVCRCGRTDCGHIKALFYTKGRVGFL